MSTMSMETLKAIYQAKASVSPAQLYHSIAPAASALPFVTMQVYDTLPIYVSSGTAYEEVYIDFTVVAETDTQVEEVWAKVLTMCNSASIASTYSIIRVAQRGKKMTRMPMRSRDNKLVWVGVSRIDIWVCNAE